MQVTVDKEFSLLGIHRNLTSFQLITFTQMYERLLKHEIVFKMPVLYGGVLTDLQ